MTKKVLFDWLPPEKSTAEGPRHVGVEIELAGVSLEVMSKCITSLFGGEIKAHTPLEYVVANSEFGDFRLELDASYLKALAEKREDVSGNWDGITDAAVQLITWAAEQVVPWEIVAPPIEISKLSHLENLVDDLRSQGALGTRHALHYAFGVHLNPELPNLKTHTILNYLRAYFCLYDWIVEQDQTDTTRQLSPYINHFETEYITTVIDLDYTPSRSELIEDYLKYNPTRNRSLDLLPLFAHMDADHVKSVVDDPRIKSRPTFHYRLPNCDIDNPEWNLSFPWQLWLEVEKLAHHPEMLKTLCIEYRKELSRNTSTLKSRWAKRIANLITEAEYL